MHVDLFLGHSHFQLVINSQWACSLELKSYTMSYKPNVCMLKYSMTIPIKIKHMLITWSIVKPKERVCYTISLATYYTTNWR